MEFLNLHFGGEPKAIQSVRFARMGEHVRKYQPKANTEWKAYIRLAAEQQIPTDFILLDEPIMIDAEFLFTPPKSLKKWQLEAIKAGRNIYKTTKPDLTDNLMKGLIDALTGVVWRDDSIIVRVWSAKKYAMEPGIKIRVAKMATAKNNKQEEVKQPVFGF